MVLDTTSYAVPVARTVEVLRKQVAAWRSNGKTVGMVPTMGALHAGHLSLVEQAKAACDHVVVSIFVNPTQFAPHEDFDDYPRTEADDAIKLADTGTDLIFGPNAREMYPDGFSTAITVSGVSRDLESVTRPHFFGGVATVVSKLLIQCGPDKAFFGEKDYQQLQVIKRLAADLNLPTEIVGGTTMREEDGLAMSSRNSYLNDDERLKAATIYRVMLRINALLQQGETIENACSWGEEELRANGFSPIDYVTVRDAETLSTIEQLESPARILIAAKLGSTRLIDNMAVSV